jgi:hypothetical protein
MIELPTELPADLAPLSWLLGVWEGTGVIDYEADGHHFSGEFTHRVSFSHDGGDAVNYSATAWLGEGESRRLLVSEVGFWRVVRPQGPGDPGPGLLPAVSDEPARTADDVEALRTAEGGFEIAANIVHADGVSELYLGQIRGPRIDIATDAVIAAPGTKAYAAATRLYGLVDGHLLWAWDIAALGSELGSHASARLAKVD